MGNRTQNRCLTIAVVTILLLLITHVSIICWMSSQSVKDEPIITVRNTTRATRVKKRPPQRTNTHTKRKHISSPQIPSPIKLLDMNCTTTPHGGLNCMYPDDKNQTDGATYVTIYNDEVFYSNHKPAISLTFPLLLINIL